MNRDRVSGILLIAGALAGVLVMALHPTAHRVIEAGGGSDVGRLNVLVHGAAILAAPIVYFGLIGLSRRLGFSDLSIAALVAHGFASVAVMCAALSSGFVATPLLRDFAGADAAARDTLHLFLDYTSYWNHAFAKVYVAASGVGIALWSAAILTTHTMARALGIAGAIIGTILFGMTIVGHLHLDLHHFGFVMLLESGWLVAAGAAMLRGARD